MERYRALDQLREERFCPSLQGLPHGAEKGTDRSKHLNQGV
jgi:hypothetical protein